MMSLASKNKMTYLKHVMGQNVLESISYVHVSGYWRPYLDQIVVVQCL